MGEIGRFSGFCYVSPFEVAEHLRKGPFSEVFVISSLVSWLDMCEEVNF
jgi:hypothetical protein